MKTFNKFIVTTLLLYLSFCILNSAEAKSCYTSKCPRGVNASAFTSDFSITYPFFLEHEQDNSSCSVPGFELSCHKTIGTLIQLPNNVTLRVDDINYLDKYVTVSDPNNCLPRKLMSLDLTDTPFEDLSTVYFWLYNCSGDDYLSRYDRIDCLSGSGHTVISSAQKDIGNFGGSNCSFVKILKVPMSYSSSYYEGTLNSVVRAYLTWNGFPIASPPRKESHSRDLGTPVLLPALMATVFVGLLVLFWYCRTCVYINTQASATSTATTSTSTDNVGTTSSVLVPDGLDQVTIDSYPVIVLGDSRRLLKSDDDTCPICLAEYQPRETLKMLLPQCRHCFHKECIDQWLRSKGVCPFCRTSPPLENSHSHQV